MLPTPRLFLINGYHILIDGLFDSIPILLTFIALAFSKDDTLVGLMVSACSAVGIAAGLGTLALSKRCTYTQATALICALCGFGFVAAAFTSNIYITGLCFVIAAAGHPVFHNLSFSYLTIHTDRRHLGRTMSDFTAFGDIGRIPLISLAAFAAAQSYLNLPGWRMVCFIYGVLALCAACWLMISSFNKNDTLSTSASQQRSFPKFSMLKRKDVFLSMLSSVLNAFSNDRVFTFLPLLLIAKGIDPKIIGAFAFGFTFGSFLGKMACGRFVDVFGSRKVFIVAELLLTILLVVLINISSVTTFVIVALLLGIVTKGTVPIIQTIITEPVQGANSYDDVFAINTFLRGITNMLTPLLFGWMATLWHIDASYALMALISVVAVLPILVMHTSLPAGVEEKN